MSVTVLGDYQAESIVSQEELTNIASHAGISIPPSHLPDFCALLSGLNHCAKEILTHEDYYPKVDFELYPRTDIHRPGDTDKGGWATKATVKSTKPLSDELKGVTVALKDNIALAAVKCTNGTGALDWTPEVDATLVTRILDAGGVIKGKAACENNCFGAVSDTSVTGPVHNPYADGYSTGGSSSGSARLVATGSVDMAIGADQGGSIRLPAAHCGIVGLKPTWGLVPYTGVISLEATIDHVGPMTRNVQDCATLLEVIAGRDGIDDRQPHNMPPGSIKYGSLLRAHLQIKDQPLKGVKIGILEEGFKDPMTDPNVTSVCWSAISKFTSLGATVTSVSIPQHATSSLLWMVALPMPSLRSGLLSFPTGRRQLLFPSRALATGPRLSQAAFDALGPGGQNMYLRGLYLTEKYGAPLQAHCTNLLRKLADTYDAAFDRDTGVDVLMMPTIIYPATKLRSPSQMPGGDAEMGPLEMLSRTIGATYNTAPFNSSGHPALSIPVGFVPARDEEGRKRGVKLPTGLQIVGRKWEDEVVLRVGGCWEQAFKWREFGAE